jgi:hypothetical protein
MDSVAELLIGTTKHTVLEVQPHSSGILILTLAVPFTQQPREKFGLLVRGSTREPVRIGIVLGTPQLRVSPVY